MELLAANVKCTAVQLKVNSISGDTVSVSYQTLPGNNPNTNGNFISIWPAADNTIPWGDAPLKSRPVRLNKAKGDLVIADLDLPEDQYILGYSLANFAEVSEGEADNYCASVFVPSLAEGAEYTQTVMELDVSQIGSFSATVSYSILPGYSPKACHNWIGLWDAAESVLSHTPQCVVPVDKTSCTGKIALNDLRLVKDHSYTVCYFTGGYQPENAAESSRKQLACMVQFDAVSP